MIRTVHKITSLLLSGRAQQPRGTWLHAQIMGKIRTRKRYKMHSKPQGGEPSSNSTRITHKEEYVCVCSMAHY